MNKEEFDKKNMELIEYAMRTPDKISLADIIEIMEVNKLSVMQTPITKDIEELTLRIRVIEQKLKLLGEGIEVIRGIAIGIRSKIETEERDNKILPPRF